MLFLGIISWKGASRFNGGGCFSDRGFLSGGSTLGASVLMEGVEKNRRMGGGALHAPPLSETLLWVGGVTYFYGPFWVMRLHLLYHQTIIFTREDGVYQQ